MEGRIKEHMLIKIEMSVQNVPNLATSLIQFEFQRKKHSSNVIQRRKILNKPEISFPHIKPIFIILYARFKNEVVIKPGVLQMMTTSLSKRASSITNIGLCDGTKVKSYLIYSTL